MKRIFNMKNIGLLLILVLITVLTLSIKEAKAAGTVTWSGPSSITIRETINNVSGPLVATREFDLINEDDLTVPVTTTMNYTSSDTPTNYQITKTATLNLSNISFTKPGDYHYYIGTLDLKNANNQSLENYFTLTDDYVTALYKVTVQIQNVVDASGTPTGNFTAAMILNKCRSTRSITCTKVSESGGTLTANYEYETNSASFGSIAITKMVTGIGADTNKYFPVTITVNNDPASTYPLGTAGWSYPVLIVEEGQDGEFTDVTNEAITYNGQTRTQPTSITVGTSTTVYLKHYQAAMIGYKGSINGEPLIPIGECSQTDIHGLQSDAYDFSKKPQLKKLASVDGLYCYGSYFSAEENPGDYTPSYFDLRTNGLAPGYSIPSAAVEPINEIGFINNKEMSPVTGLIFTILPYLILAGIGIGGTLLFMSLKKKKTNKV